MTESDLFLSRIEDKIHQCEAEYRVVSTGFLSMSERSEAAAFCKRMGVRALFYGGSPDAERCVLLLLPDYYDETAFDPIGEDCPVALLRCHAKAGSKALTHRDYLGAILALGIKREVIGDILVTEDGADILVQKAMLTYLLMHFDKAGNTLLNCKEAPIDTLRVPEKRITVLRESVASLRLDNLLCAAFDLSRESAAEAIGSGRVFVNDTEATKPDARVAAGDKLVLRGMGKAIFREVVGTTRKGRISVRIEKYS